MDDVRRLLCPYMTQVLSYFNETGSQGERLHLHSLGPNATGELICFNESEPGGATGTHSSRLRGWDLTDSFFKWLLHRPSPFNTDGHYWQSREREKGSKGSRTCLDFKERAKLSKDLSTPQLNIQWCLSENHSGMHWFSFQSICFDSSLCFSYWPCCVSPTVKKQNIHDQKKATRSQVTEQ